MITWRDVNLGVLLPVAVTAALMLLVAAARGRWRDIFVPLAIAAGFLSGYAALLHIPPVPPLDSTEWLFYAGAGIGVVAALDALVNRFDRRIRRPMWVARALVVTAISTGLMWQITRVMFVYSWTNVQGWTWIMGIAGTMLLLWIALDLLAARAPTSPSILGGLALVIACAAATIAMSGTLKLAQIAGILAAATGGAAVVGAVFPSLLPLRSVMLLVALLYVPLLVSATTHLFAQLSTLNAALLLAAPALAWAGELVPTRFRFATAATIVLRIFAPLVPALIAVLLAALEFARQAADYQNYSF